MPVDFLTTEQVESYGRFTGEPDELQLARYFHLDEADKEFIGKSRGDHNRLGIALQIGCVRFLGTFLTDMNHIPSGVRHFTARQLGIRDITVLAEYGQRENTRREHAALIRQHYQYREFAWPWTFRLTRLLYTRSWISNERPSGLTQAIIEVGRINKTLYLLNYIDDEDYRRRILTQLNRGESRHAVARAICHGQKGEIRKRYTDGQEDQLGALGLVTNAVVLWNTIYMQAALDHLRAQGETLNDEDIARLSPLCHGHINMLGHYSFTLAELVTKGHLRPLKEASEAENVA
ncbi:Tn3 family transposase [Salmonella enterica]|nr:Tn3 family transposase [Salmonella enterica]ECB1809819.1 Tn3 family transposase [Salmonella enterica subsp. enterica serovar Saintpaul]EAW3627945.1 Tn3 family transposase [Salmonella enterica]EBG4178117.1 Tn3 family transposase [Salmonella enterica]ECB1809883.1 Tn3 family transposase [Salmonella enterica subsp. enterica serovar Saintpaul]